MTKSIDLVVVSDLHPSPETGASNESFLNMASSADPCINPVAGFCKLCDDITLTADYLLCPGDIGNKGDPRTINFGWSQLHQIASKLDARVLAVPGNHDHDSRSIHNGFDPKYHLQSLAPDFPFTEFDKNAKFWAYHWGEILEPNSRFVLLNTSAFHGLASEHTHGRVTPLTLMQIMEYLNTSDDQMLNLMLCHHHPQRLDEMYISDYDAMEGGSELVKILSDGLKGRWLIVHGHKHTPRIVYSSSYGSQSTVLFSSASFSGPIAPELIGRSTNQVHHVRVCPTASVEHGCVSGIVRSWEWNHGIGWQEALSGRGLPKVAGFGFRRSLDAMATDLVTRFGAEPFVTGDSIYTEFPSYRFLTPADLDGLVKYLNDKHNATLEVSHGEIKQFATSTEQGA